MKKNEKKKRERSVEKRKREREREREMGAWILLPQFLCVFLLCLLLQYRFSGFRGRSFLVISATIFGWAITFSCVFLVPDDVISVLHLDTNCSAYEVQHGDEEERWGWEREEGREEREREEREREEREREGVGVERGRGERERFLKLSKSDLSSESVTQRDLFIPNTTSTISTEKFVSPLKEDVSQIPTVRSNFPDHTRDLDDPSQGTSSVTPTPTPSPTPSKSITPTPTPYKATPALAVVPQRVLVFLWSFLYWGSFASCWVLFPVLISYVDMAHFTVNERASAAVKENLVIYL